jgi:hypothetical protein
MNIINYIELQRNLSQVAAEHRRALDLILALWTSLQSVEVDLGEVYSTMVRFLQAERTASYSFHALLTKHAQSSKIMRMWGRFIEEIRCSPEQVPTHALPPADLSAWPRGLVMHFLTL